MKFKLSTKKLKDFCSKSPTRRLIFMHREVGKEITPSNGFDFISRETRDYFRHEASGIVFIRVLWIREATPYSKAWQHVSWHKDEGHGKISGSAGIGYWLRELNKTKGF